MAGTPLASVGTVKYGEITFNSRSRTHILVTPIKDEAGRTIIYNRYLLTVEGWVTPQDYGGSSATNTDEDFQAMRRQLLHPAKELTFEDKGFGDISINVTTARDVLWGPFPTMLEWTPVGAAKACFFKWQVEWHAPDCPGAVYSDNFSAWNYETTFTIGQPGPGLTTRTISGYAEIPMNRVLQGGTNMVLRESADEYREDINWPVPLGFRRDTATFRLNKAKNRLDFTFVDVEMESQNPLPDGVTHADITASIKSSGKGGTFNFWFWSLGGTIKVAPDRPTVDAFNKWMIVLDNRLRWLINNQGLIKQNSPGGPSRAVFIAPIEQSYSEKVFALESSFSITFMIVTGLEGTPANILRASGLWKPLNTSWGAWQTGMEVSAHHVRGNAELRHLPSSDVIIDLCHPATNSPTQPSVKDVPFSSPGQFGVCDPSGYGSYIWYANEIETHEIGGVVHHTPLKAGAKLITQVRHDPAYMIVLHGWGLRIGRTTPVPSLVSVGGIPVERVGDPYVREKIVATICGWPIYRTSWRIQYRLKTTDTSKYQAPGTPPPSVPDTSGFLGGGGASSAPPPPPPGWVTGGGSSGGQTGGTGRDVLYPDITSNE